MNSKKIGFLFPGQGSQLFGMGKDFYERYDVSKNIFILSEEVTGINVRKLCFEKNDELEQTDKLQLCLFTVCTAMLAALREEGIRADVHAGLSLGEYVAVGASGVIALEDLFSLVKKRGELMNLAYRGESAMVAIASNQIDLIEKECRNNGGMVSVANYNSPTQSVITGEKKAVYQVVEALKDNGIIHVFPLNVSGPFHSKLMQSAKVGLEDALRNIALYSIDIPYVSNVTGKYVTSVDEVKTLLVKQVVSPVRWYHGIQEMINNGIKTFVEVGPNRTLSNMLLSIDRTLERINIGTVNDIKKLTN